MAGFGKKNSGAGNASFGQKRGAAPLSPQAQAFLNEQRSQPEPTANTDPLGFLNAGGGGGSSSAGPSRSRNADSLQAGEPVGFMRLFAFLIDTLIFGIPFFIIFQGPLMAYIEAPAGSAEEAQYTLAVYGAIFGMNILRFFYAVAMEASSLQATVGKLVMGYIVTDKNGDKPSLMAVILRNSVGRWVLNLIPFSLGYVMAFFGEKRGVHDYISGSRVCKKSQQTASYSEVFA